MPSSQPRRRSALALVLALALALAVAVPAAAAPTWLPPQDVSPFDAAVNSVAAGADGQGGVVAAWVRRNGTDNIVEVAHRAPGGAFSVQTLQSGASAKSDVRVAVNEAGAAVVAWRNAAATAEIWAATRSAPGEFGIPVAVASVPGKHAYDPSVAIGDNGHTAVLWRLDNSDTDRLQTVYAAFRAPGQAFASGPLSTSDTWNQSPRGVIAPDGKLTVVWSFWDGTTNFARVRVRSADGTLGTQRNLSGGVPTGYPVFATVDLDAAGNAVAVWSQWDGTVYDVKGATRSAGSDSWNTLPAFGESAGASFGDEPQVAVDKDGNAVAIWRAPDRTIRAASRAAGAAFGVAQEGISAPTASAPKVALDGAGNAIAVWLRTDADGARIEAAVRPLGGSFGAVRRISAETGTSLPALAMDGMGNAFAVWRQHDPTLPVGSQNGVRYAVYDASPPAIESVDVASAGVAETPVSMSAVASDVWTASPAMSWSFGDGDSASGASTSHAYAAAGTYTVTVTATDSVGNSASATRSIRVSPKPVPPPADADADGSPAGEDCNDANPAVRPGAAEVPNNGVDEDCADGDLVARVGGKVSARWKIAKAFTSFRRARVVGVPEGGTVTVSCKGKGCPRKRTFSVPAGGAKSILAAFKRGKRPARIKPGSRVYVLVTVPDLLGRMTVFRIRAGKKPSVKAVQCATPGATTPAGASC